MALIMENVLLAEALWIQVEMGVIKLLHVSATESQDVYLKLKQSEELTVSISSLHTPGLKLIPQLSHWLHRG